MGPRGWRFRRSGLCCTTQWCVRRPRTRRSTASRRPGCRGRWSEVPSRGSGPEWGSLQCHEGQSSHRCHRRDGALPSSPSLTRLRRNYRMKETRALRGHWAAQSQSRCETLITRRSHRCRWIRPTPASSAWPLTPRSSAAGPRSRCSGSWSDGDEDEHRRQEDTCTDRASTFWPCLTTRRWKVPAHRAAGVLTQAPTQTAFPWFCDVSSNKSGAHSFTCPSANSFSSLSCARAVSPAETHRWTLLVLYVHGSRRRATRGWSSPEAAGSRSSPSDACLPMSLCSSMLTRLCSWALSRSSVSTAVCRVLAMAFSTRRTAICNQSQHNDDTANQERVCQAACEYLVPQNLQLAIFVWD